MVASDSCHGSEGAIVVPGISHQTAAVQGPQREDRQEYGVESQSETKPGDRRQVPEQAAPRRVRHREASCDGRFDGIAAEPSSGSYSMKSYGDRQDEKKLRSGNRGNAAPNISSKSRRNVLTGVSAACHTPGSTPGARMALRMESRSRVSVACGSLQCTPRPGPCSPG